MGLIDAYLFCDNKTALDVAVNLARWFYDWSGKFTREKFNEILDVETGGMLEMWAELYGITGESFIKELIDRYYRTNLFDPLLDGKDVLTNMHANTTIPEVMGAARAYEVTGDKKWFDIIVAYWNMAVTERGTYATGGQTCGEIWSPPNALSARLGDKNQEHCTVYNMMRLAEFLFRHTGEVCYCDYWELNLYNGIMAQAYWKGNASHGLDNNHPDRGLLTYFLPLRSGARKGWSSETEDFFCCHGTLVQANASFTEGLYYQDEKSVSICQYFASTAKFDLNDSDITIKLEIDQQAGNKNVSSVQNRAQSISEVTSVVHHNPDLLAVDLDIKCEKKSEFTLRIRVPQWNKGYKIYLDGKEIIDPVISKGFIEITHCWHNNKVRYEVKKALTLSMLPDENQTYAFMYGPIVLAGLCTNEYILYGNADEPDRILIPDNEREWGMWQNTFRTRGQYMGFKFIPLNKVGYEPYTVYFPIRPEK